MLAALLRFGYFAEPTELGGLLQPLCRLTDASLDANLSHLFFGSAPARGAPATDADGGDATAAEWSAASLAPKWVSPRGYVQLLEDDETSKAAVAGAAADVDEAVVDRYDRYADQMSEPLRRLTEARGAALRVLSAASDVHQVSLYDVT